MTVTTPLEAAEWVRAFIADLPGKVFRSIMWTLSQTKALLALIFAFILGVVGQPIAGPYLARYGLPVVKAEPSPPQKPDAVLGQIQRLYALTGEQTQALAAVQGSVEAIKATLRQRAPEPAPAPVAKRQRPKPATKPAEPDSLTTFKESVKELVKPAEK